METGESKTGRNTCRIPEQEKPVVLNVFRIRPIRIIFRFVPLLLLVWAGALLLAAPHFLPGRVMLSTGVLTAALALIAFQLLMQKIPREFETLWCRGILSERAPVQGRSPDTGDSPAAPGQGDSHTNYADDRPFREYLTETEDRMNSPLQWACAGLFMILPLTWFPAWYLAGIAKDISRMDLVAAEIIIAFLLGMMAWRMLVLGLQILKLPKRFSLEIQPSHPDQCGGMEPLGTLCLLNALIIIIPGIYLGGWMAVGPVAGGGFREIARQYQPIFLVLLVIPIVFSVITFIVPLWSTHTEMIARKAGILRNLDELAESIDRRNRKLLVFTHDNGDGSERMKSLGEMQAGIESLQKIYDQSRNIPEWPVNTSILIKFLSSQAVPLLSLVGIGEPVAKFLASAFLFLTTGSAG